MKLPQSAADEKQDRRNYPGASARRFGGSRLTERAQGAFFVLLDFEDMIQFCNSQQLVDVGARVNELELPAAAANGRMSPHEFSQPSAVDEIDAFQVQENAIVSVLQLIVNRVAKQARSFSKRDFADKIGNHGAMRLAQTDCASWGRGFFHTQPVLVEDFASGRSDLGGLGADNDNRVAFTQDPAEKI
jgi:hypothetical protein